MKLLFIHASRIWYRVGRKTPIAEELEEKGREGEMENCLVAFSCVEKFDELKPEASVDMMKGEILKAVADLKIKKVMIFPFAHLSQSLSSPKIALNILNDSENALRESGLEVKRVPFGWNKKFKLESMGHPMAVLSRALCPIMDKCKFRCPHCDGPLPDKLTQVI